MQGGGVYLGRVFLGWGPLHTSVGTRHYGARSCKHMRVAMRHYGGPLLQAYECWDEAPLRVLRGWGGIPGQVVGPLNAGKSSLTRLMVNYACRERVSQEPGAQRMQPLFVDLDIGALFVLLFGLACACLLSLRLDSLAASNHTRKAK